MSCPVCGKEHHALCHKCPHDAEVKAGKWFNVAFDKTPCFGCRMGQEDRNRHVCGKEVVSFDEAEEVIGELDLQAEEMNRFLSALQTVLRNILGMGDGVTREIVMRRMVNDSLQDVAQATSVMFRTHMTLQAVHTREKKAMKKNNLIRALLLAFRNKKGRS
jgi:hypothetical protein